MTFAPAKNFFKIISPMVTGTLKYGTWPMLKVDDGKVTIFDSMAILRFVGKMCKLYPEDLLEAAKVDEILGSSEDMASKLGLETLEIFILVKK